MNYTVLSYYIITLCIFLSVFLKQSFMTFKFHFSLEISSVDAHISTHLDHRFRHQFLEGKKSCTTYYFLLMDVQYLKTKECGN